MDQSLRREAKRTQLDYNNLKSGGFIKQIQENLFTVRLRCPGGRITSAQLRKAADIAEKYGKGEVHTSVRQSIEVPHVHYQHFDAISKELREMGWSVASCGPRIRVPTACAGCSWNPNGIMDTQKACLEVDRRYFGTESGHHKFKITFAGCPIDCPRSRGADIGFQGIIEPEVAEDLCNGCTLCAVSCEEKALTIINGLPVRDAQKCNYCGDCIKVCPIDAMKSKRKGWLVRVGGKHGKHPYYSYEVARFASDEQCYALIEKTMPWYKANANGRERIAVAIERAGLGKYLDEVVKPLGLEVIEKPEDRKKFWAAGNLYK